MSKAKVTNDNINSMFYNGELVLGLHPESETQYNLILNQIKNPITEDECFNKSWYLSRWNLGDDIHHITSSSVKKMIFPFIDDGEVYANFIYDNKIYKLKFVIVATRGLNDYA